jgi:DAACS family dicarboxylate/amino acid:cation (Na+ or H+) symporter
MNAPRKGKLPLPTRILLGLVLGAAAGITLNLLLVPGSASHDFTTGFDANIAYPLGRLFLNLLFMVVVPIVFCSLFLGVAGLGSLQTLGRLGGRTLLWFLGTTALAVLLGLALVHSIEPGRRIDPAAAELVQQRYAGDAAARIAQGKEASAFTVDSLVAIVPTNVVAAAADNKQILGLIFFALVLGAAATRLPAERTRVLRELLQSLYDLCVRVLGWAMEIAPYGVAGLIFHATFGLGLDILKLVLWYFGTAMAGLVIHQLVVITGLAWLFAGVRPGRFYRGCRALIVTAFSTSSSSATMPTTIRTATDEFGAPAEIAGFVIPLGATMNMNGTALFEGVSVLFLAQVAGIELGLGEQVLVLGLTVLTAIGAAGVPGGSLPLLAIVLTYVGVPAEYLALILGVDRLVDMARTVPNVTSDLVCSLWLSRRLRAAAATTPPSPPSS